ncbi:hypothetical protein KSF73_03585 [Burkholderiaceae bacterium DAT-1]|nr:hypothetical protein [Burkholderiaceae bacterium DAT-1]
MSWFKRYQEQSRIGELLLRKRLISHEQLEQAISQQVLTGGRLGDILIARGLVTQKQINALLRKQKIARRVAAVLAVLLGPMQAFAAAPAPVNNSSGPQTHASMAVSATSGMHRLDDDELRDVVGQGGLNAALQAWAEQNQHLFQQNVSLFSIQNQLNNKQFGQAASSLQAMTGLMTLLNPLMAFLGGQAVMSGVKFDQANAQGVVNKDGSITISLPSTIGQIAINNIQLNGNPNGTNWGSIAISNINMGGSTITIGPSKRG